MSQNVKLHLEQNSLCVKETNKFFRAQFQIQTFVETARVVWMQKPEIFNSLYGMSLKSVFLELMLHVITRLFNTYAFIWCATIISASIPPLNKLIALTAFDSNFNSSCIVLSLAGISKKDMKYFLPLSPQFWEGSCVSGIAKQHPSWHLLLAQTWQ